MFSIPKGTKVTAITVGPKGNMASIKCVAIKRHAIYDKQHVMVDPVGELGTVNRTTVGGNGCLDTYLKDGWYGFSLPKGSGYDVLLVPSDKVKYLD